MAADKYIDHSWYAVRVTGTALSVFSQQLIFAGPQGGTHKFSVPDLDQRLNIEVEFEKEGVQYFVPCVIDGIEHRRKRGVTIIRRRPLIPGYAFVQYVADWQKLKDIKNVVDVVKSAGNPVKVPNTDIHFLRMVEWQSYCDFAEPEKDRLKRKYPVGSKHVINHKKVGVIDITILSVTSKKKVKAFSDWLGKIEFAVEDIAAA